MSVNRSLHARWAFLIVSLVAAIASAQAQPSEVNPQAAPPPGGSDVALSPSRLELPIPAGQEQTVVVNVTSTGGDPGGKPLRLLASLGDWTLSRTGELQFGKPGSQARSAAPWMIYSPVELEVRPGRSHPIRVTIAVPKDTPPGDYTAVMFVEERPGELKTRRSAKQILFHFRLAAIFYIMVPPLQPKGELVNLSAETKTNALVVKPVLRNAGNTHFRPMQSLQILNEAGKVIAETPLSEAYPILAGTEAERPVTLERALDPGKYSVRYRVDFKDGGKVVEGRTSVTVEPPAPAAPAPAPAKKKKGGR